MAKTKSELAARFKRRTWLLPLVLLLVVVPGYLLSSYYQSKPITSHKVIADWYEISPQLVFIFLPVTYVPFLLLGRIGGKAISRKKSNIYNEYGALIGISIVTALFWLMVGAVAAESVDPKLFYGQGFAILFVVVFPIAGILAIFVGTVVGTVVEKFKTECDDTFSDSDEPSPPASRGSL